MDYERACKSAGIAPRTIYNWKTRAEAGDERAIAFVQALEKAEADVERRVTRNVLRASEKDAYWAAGMTWLERRYPDRYGKRDEAGVTAKIEVRIGGIDITAQLAAVRGETSLSPSTFASLEGRNPDANLLIPQGYAEPSRLINGDYVHPIDAVPIAAAAAVISDSGAGLVGGPTPVGEAPLAATGGTQVKGRSRARKEKRASR